VPKSVENLLVYEKDVSACFLQRQTILPFVKRENLDLQTKKGGLDFCLNL